MQCLPLPLPCKQEGTCCSGAIADAGGNTAAVATASAASLLLTLGRRTDRGRHDDGVDDSGASSGSPVVASEAASLALAHLPWLLAHGPRSALCVLRGLGEALSVAAVLPLLEDGGGGGAEGSGGVSAGHDVRWEYLHYLVHGRVSIRGMGGEHRLKMCRGWPLLRPRPCPRLPSLPASSPSPLAMPPSPGP